MENNAPLCKRPDLRTLATQKLDEILKDLGISEEEFRSLNRWEKVAEISENCKQNQDQTDKSVDTGSQSTTLTSIIIVDEISENNPEPKESKREIQKIIELRSKEEVIVQFKNAEHPEIVGRDEMKSKYPLELLNFYEEKYFSYMEKDKK